MRNAAGQGAHGLELLRLAQLLLQLAPALLRGHPGADIHHRRQDKHPLVGDHGGEPYFERHLGAILAPAEQLPPAAHGPHFRAGGELAAVPRVAGMEPLRYQQLDRLPQQLLAHVAEEPFDLAVHEHDLALGIRHEDAAGRGFHGGAQPEVCRLRGMRVHEFAI